ncbi:MAG: hypothetical protein V5A62_06510 [Haloarculaceae archaeon]
MTDVSLDGRRYSGESIRFGFLVGLRDGDSLFARYTQVTTEGGTATGHTECRVETTADGRVRLREGWAWDPGRGRGRASRRWRRNGTRMPTVA